MLQTTLSKGIALFTPGCDLVYCIDPHKQNRWHLQLCLFLQGLLGLTEPPHFLVPCFTATVDHWQDPRSQTIVTFAEIHPFVMRHRSLLNAVFGCTEINWQVTQPTLCDPFVIAAYRQQFPQLWQCHDLVARLEPMEPALPPPDKLLAPIWSVEPGFQPQRYVFRLFVADNSMATERILQTLHQLLEEHLRQPYSLKVIDVRRHPEQAEADQVTATPTLVKASPQPVRRLVGQIDSSTALLQLIR
ncbi:MAG: circadian clock KaiB family protein [Elainella sp.]